MIIDASALIVSIADARKAESLRGAEWAAPDLIIPETLNAFWRIGNAGGRVPEADDILAMLDCIKVLPSRPYALRAAAFARTMKHPVYDCLYLAVAEIESDILLTSDKRFVRAIKPRSLRQHVRLLT